jgi:hypothetical protein
MSFKSDMRAANIGAEADVPSKLSKFKVIDGIPTGRMIPFATMMTLCPIALRSMELEGYLAMNYYQDILFLLS